MSALNRIGILILIFGALIWNGCQSSPKPEKAEHSENLPLFNSNVFDSVDAEIVKAVSEKRLPGAVIWIERKGEVYQKAYENRALVPRVEPMTRDTIFDLASLTKVVAGTPAVMLLIQDGKLGLEDKVSKYIPEFSGGQKEEVTIRQLLTHTSGLRGDVSMTPAWSGYDKAIQLACAEKLQSPPGTAFRYSDINFFLLGHIVKVVSGKSLSDFLQERLYRPLGMEQTFFNPSTNFVSRIAPTEVVEGKPWRGIVHDPTARRMGGIAGHAGLFSTAADLAIYCRMLLNMGSYHGVEIFKPETVRLMTAVQTPELMVARRGLGWDIDTGYSKPRGDRLPLGSYGHTGFTGTAIWVDPFSQTFYLFLSNRVHPDGTGSILELEHTLGNLVASSVAGFDFNNVPNALAAKRDVSSGIDVLKKEKFARLKGLRVGLVTNQTGRDRTGTSTIDLLFKAEGVKLVRLFSPEHGIRGAVDEQLGDSVDAQTKLPIISLYKDAPKRNAGESDRDYELRVLESRAPSEQQVRDLDALVFDIQDIGCRFYTYISTLGGAVESASHYHKKIFVLDRINPIGGVEVEGPVQSRHSSFIGYHPIPVRHGMTPGELAKMFNDERGLKADLVVVNCEGWSRDLWYDETSLPWVNPSPNMRNLRAAVLYPGIGLLEFNPVSVGRGTETPFEVLGAPYIDGAKLANELNAFHFTGVNFSAVDFTPASSTFRGQVCHGVRLEVSNGKQMHPVDIGISIARILQRDYSKEFQLEKFEKLVGNGSVVEAIRRQEKLTQIKSGWENSLNEFRERRKKYLIY